MRAAISADLDLNAVVTALPTQISARRFYTTLNVRCPDTFGLAPLHCAAARNRADTITPLLDAGADPTARNEFFWTAADLADANGACHALRALSRRGINPSPDGRSVTTFHLMGITFPDDKPAR